jgi:capsular exopolysaccharide synthesis family protein
MTLPFPFQEAIRGVRTQLLLSNDAETPRTFVVTSASTGEGKTIIASNLAVAMAMTGRRVLLVDADLRRPQVHTVFNVPRSPGLSDVINGDVKPTQTMSASSVKGLFVLPVGVDVQNAADLLDSDRLSPLIQRMRQVFDIVVIDCPPVMAVADAAIVANAATSVIFVIGSGTTSREAAHEALARLTAVRAHVLGIVLNKAKLSARSAYSYHQYANAEV